MLFSVTRVGICYWISIFIGTPISSGSISVEGPITVLADASILFYVIFDLINPPFFSNFAFKDIFGFFEDPSWLDVPKISA